MSKSIIASRIGSIITTAPFDVPSQICVHKVTICQRPRSVKASDTGVVCIECLVSRPDIEARFLGNNLQNTLPAAIRSIRNGVVRVVFGDVLSAGLGQ